MRSPVRATVVCALGLAVCTAAAPRAPADVTTEHGASILLFPRIVADGSRDTVVQVANLSNSSAHVVCNYVNGASAGWQSLGFNFALGSGRPTHWTAATGRAPDASPGSVDIPAAPAGFRGELICVEVGVDGAPADGNDLAGEATTVDLGNGDVAAYTAFGLRSAPTLDGDNVLCIGGMPLQPSDNCPNFVGEEYDGCPAEWILSLPAEGAADPLLPSGSVTTRVTVAPCSQDLQGETPGSVDIDVTVVNELGQQFVATLHVTCWADLSLADIGARVFTRGALGTDFAQARFQPAEGSGGFVLVAETTRSNQHVPPQTSAAAVIPHTRGSTATTDLLVLPAVRP